MNKEIKKVNIKELFEQSDFAMHFRYMGLENEILENAGIDATIGEQSQIGGKIGGEKFAKIAVSLGIDGAMLTTNRFLTAPFGKPLKSIQNALKFYANFTGEEPEEGKIDLTHKSLDYKLSPTNPEDMKSALDIMEKFYESRYYYQITNFKPIQYEHSLNSESITTISNEVQLANRTSTIKELYKQKKYEEGFKQLKDLRADIVKKMDEIRGEKIQDGMYNEWDFSENILKIENFGAHNIYPEIIQSEDENRYASKNINLNNIFRIKSEGKEEMSALEVIQKMSELREKSYYAKYTNHPHKIEAPLVEFFVQYTKIPKENQVERITMAEKISYYYKNFLEFTSQYGKETTVDDIESELKSFTQNAFSEIIKDSEIPRSLSKQGITSFAKDENIALETQNALEDITTLEKTREVGKNQNTPNLE